VAGGAGPGRSGAGYAYPWRGCAHAGCPARRAQGGGGFFDHYEPERPFLAYACDSWIFSPQIEALLLPESNILRWQHEGYLFPADDDEGSFLLFTFGSATIDLATAPQDTRLRRAVVAHLAGGGALRSGRSLLLRTDLSRFGTQPYRQASEQAIARLLADPHA
jgi:hypothetical protein